MLTVSPLRAFSDNYIWLIRGLTDSRVVAVVDPGDAQPVQQALDEAELTLAAILITHHHGDHIGGIEALVREHGCPVFGPAHERIPGRTEAVAEGDVVDLPQLGLRFSVLDVPGHTAGHVAYVGHGAMFCGDTLFSAGCGRLFEGTAEQMHVSLSKLAGLDPATRVYCTHEYTLSNLRFARAVEPNNIDIERYLAYAAQQRQQDLPTLPSTLELEHKVNPFLRCRLQNVKQAAERHAGRALDSTVDVFAAVRAWKDAFKPLPDPAVLAAQP